MAPLQERLQAPGDSVVIEEVRLRHRSGRYVPVLARGFVSRDPSGRPVRVTGTAMNLTAQHQTRQLEALRAFALELIASEPDIDQILSRLVGHLEELLPSVRGLVWLLDERSGQLEPQAAHGLEGVLAKARACVWLRYKNRVSRVADNSGPFEEIA